MFVNKLRRYIRNIASLPLFIFGCLYYKITNKTPEIAYQSMIWLFCATAGSFNDWISRIIVRLRPPVKLPNTCGVLGELTKERRVSLGKQLQRDGFVIFPGALSDEVCNRLQLFAAQTPATIRPMDGEKEEIIKREIFNPNDPAAVRYDYQPNDLLDQSDVQDLLADNSILTLVQDYLNCKPYADVLSMWWHTDVLDHPDSKAAQFFHFDMDRIKWLKIFIYITDVKAENGPHSFVRGSHKTGAIPSTVLKRGYVRLSDEEVASIYPKEDILSFAAQRGSIIVEDTRGLHKGVHVKNGARLILQLQFSNSLFGTNYEKSNIKKIKSKKLFEMVATEPTIYKQYL